MKANFALLALTAGQVSAHWGAWKDAPKYTPPQAIDNKCEEHQKKGWQWDDLQLGQFEKYNDWDFKGWSCGTDKSKRDLTGRHFGKSIFADCGNKKEEAPSFGCGAGSKEKKFSLHKFHVKPEFDCRLEFHYDMPDGSTCKHQADCSKDGTDIYNTQCGGAKKVHFVYPKQPNKPKDKCRVEIPQIDFNCDKPSFPKYPKPSFPPTDDKTKTIPNGDNTKTVPAGEQTTEVPSAETTSAPYGDNTETVPAGDNTETVPAGDQTTDVSSPGETTSAPVADNTESVPYGENTKTVPADENTETVPAGENTKTVPAGEETTAPADSTETVPAGDNTKTVPAGEETTAPAENTETVPAGDNTKTVPAGDKTTDVSSPAETTSAPAGEETETVPAGENTKTVPAGEETTAPADSTETVPAGENTKTVPAGEETTAPADSTETVPAGENTKTVPAGENTKTVPAGEETTAPVEEIKTTVYDSTSTVYTTEVKTITSCGPEVTNCPVTAGTPAVVTETVAISTTICPVTETLTGDKPAHTKPAGEKPTGDKPVEGGDKPGYTAPAGEKPTGDKPAKTTEGSSPHATSDVPEEVTTIVTSYDSVSTVYKTEVKTITSCGPEVTNCPVTAGEPAVVTETHAVSTTLYPVIETVTHKAPKPVQTGSDEKPQTPEVPKDGYDVPDVVPSCLNTFLDFVQDCKDNTDAACYCPSKDFVDNVFQCLYAHAENDDTVAQAVSFFQGICAPYVEKNPGIATGADSVTEHITVTGTTIITSAHYTTVVVATTITEAYVTGGSTVEGSSTVKTIETEIVVPEVGFTSGPAGNGPVPAQTAPAEAPAAGTEAPAAPGYEVPSAGETLITNKPVVGTGGLPAPTSAPGVPVTAGAARNGMGIAAAILAVAIAL